MRMIKLWYSSESYWKIKFYRKNESVLLIKLGYPNESGRIIKIKLIKMNHNLELN